MRTTIALVIVIAGGTAACSSRATAPQVSGDDGGGAPIEAGIGFAVDCSGSLADVMAAPPSLEGAHGDVLRCAAAGTATHADIGTLLTSHQASARAPVTDVAQYRVVYQTQRADGTRDAASGAVFWPQALRATSVPVIVVAHGTAGVAQGCEPSLGADTTDPALAAMIYSLAGQGLPVIATDYAGYLPGSRAQGYLFADDEARSVLDAARALRSLEPSAFAPSVVLVGFSQGAHAVLSADSAQEAYGAGGPVAAVVAYSPLWFNMGTWGALFAEASQFKLADPGALSVIKYDVWYHYSHGEILDGPGQGLAVFAADKRAAVQDFVQHACDPGPAPQLTSLPGTVADLFDPSFVSAVELPQALGESCDGNADPARCSTWSARYASDRPHLSGSASTTPLLLVRGADDSSVPTDRFVCGLDRLSQDGVQPSLCVQPSAGHAEVVPARADYVADWIAARTLGAAEPAPCALGSNALVDDAGAPVQCATPPSND